MRRAPAAVVLAAALLALAACGKTPRPAATRHPTTPTSSTPAAPSDCRSPTSVGAHDAAFVVQLALSVDYRNVAQLPAVVQPLLTPAFFASFRQSLLAGQAAVIARKAANAVAIDTVHFASGTCAAPTYTVAVVRQTATAATGAQTANVAVSAAMSWDGTTYLLAGLTG